MKTRLSHRRVARFIPLASATLAILTLVNIGCGTKKHVREAVAPVQNQVNQTQAEVGALQKETDERKEGIAEAAAAAAQARNAATEATREAELARAEVERLREEVRASLPGPAFSPPPPPPPQLAPLPPGIKGYSDVYFATDRARISDGVFGNTASDNQEIAYGRAIVSIPSTHREGVVERPWSIFTVQLPEDPSRDMIIANRSSLDSNAFFRQVAAGIAASPSKEAFVFVHGYNVKFDEAILRVGQLEWDLHFQGPSILFSWPSRGSTDQYVSDIDMVDWAAPHLEDFLLRLRRETGAQVVHLIAHSMGARLLALALGRLKEQTREKAPVFQQIVLAAPDISVPLFKELVPALRSSSKQITIYSSERDNALRLSSLVRGGAPQIGLLVPILSGIDVIDATAVRASLLDHSYFAENPVLLEDLRQVLVEQLDAARRLMTLRKSGNVWIPISH